MEDHHVAVDRHQAEEPGGADEQQQEESHSKGRAEGGKVDQCHCVAPFDHRFMKLNIKAHIAPDFSIAFCLRPHEAFAASMKITMFTFREG